MTQRLAYKLSFRSKMFLTVFGMAAIVAPVVFGQESAAPRQTQSLTPDWQKVAGGKMEFEVASIKPSNPSEKPRAVVGLDPGDEPVPPGDLYSVTKFSVDAYIGFAYKLTPHQTRYLRSQLPKEATDQQFDIQARTEGNPTKDQLRLMMQSLLAERFKLAVHTETRQLPLFVLVLAKPGKTGPQLQPHSKDPPCSNAPQPPHSVDSPPRAKTDGDFPTICGGLLARRGPGGQTIVSSRNVSMPQIADSLPVISSEIVNREVLDRTGLVGKFDFSLEFVREPNGPDLTNSPSDLNGATFLEALNEQLGLKLEPQKGPVRVLVVDHIERPSGN